MTGERISKGFQYLIGILLFAITILVVFNSQLGILKWISNYGVQLMLGMLILGFVFFCFSLERLMFTSLICCSLLCLFLQKSANANLVLPAYTSGSALKVAHANLTNASGNIEAALQAIVACDADIVSLQEVSFPLNDRIAEVFQEKYPYHTGPMKQNDFWSVNVFSKQPFSELDTFYLGDIPSIHGGVILDNKFLPIHFISTYMLPPFSKERGIETFTNNLDRLAASRRSMDVPYLVFGGFNVASWYDEIQDFKDRAQLMDSRRGFMPAFSNPFDYPADHIFFSNQLKCVGFEIIKTVGSEDHVGIVGTYQLNDISLSNNEGGEE